jgi:hypothetical protein
MNKLFMVNISIYLLISLFFRKERGFLMKVRSFRYRGHPSQGYHLLLIVLSLRVLVHLASGTGAIKTEPDFRITNIQGAASPVIGKNR